MRTKFSLLAVLALFVLAGCKDFKVNPRKGIKIKSLRFIGEQVLPAFQFNDGAEVGGLSGIDYFDGIYYLISDAPNAPIRYYTADLDYDENSFNSVTILDEVEFLDKNGQSFASTTADPEAIRFDPLNHRIVWASEGFVNAGVDPFIRQASEEGDFVKEARLPKIFQVDTTAGKGPRNNGTFEGLCLSVDGKGYWAAMELPLEQDGPAPIFGTDTESPVRMAFISRRTGRFGRQFAYELDPVARSGGFTVNGVVEILQYARNKFLVLERSFATGYDDGGNDVKIYKVDISRATDISRYKSLNGVRYRKAKKKLLFDFNTIRSQLSTVPGSPANVVDNIEGISFGPDLPNGNKSLVVVADNNFSAFGPQLNQFIAFEILP